MTARCLTAVAALIWLADAPSMAFQAGEKVNVATATATIQTIDSATRKVTLRSEAGEEETYTAGPELKRFDELKVGDKVRLTYYESIVYQVRKPGDPAMTSSAEAAFERAKSGLPAGLLTSQQKQTVTVKQVDLTTPSITVTTADGRTVTKKVQDKAALAAVKPGDQIDVTYTEALLANIERVP